MRAEAAEEIARLREEAAKAEEARRAALEARNQAEQLRKEAEEARRIADLERQKLKELEGRDHTAYVAKRSAGVQRDHNVLKALDEQLKAHEETLAKLSAARERAENEALGAVIKESTAEKPQQSSAFDDMFSPRTAEARFNSGECSPFLSSSSLEMNFV